MIFGIDAAAVGGNKNVDWARAKSQGPCGFVFLRSNWGTTKDAFFKQWKGAQDLGLVVGAYLFLRAPRTKVKKCPSPTQQAQAMIATLDAAGYGGPGVLPPTLDVEFPGQGAKETGMTAAQLLDWVRVAWTLLRDRYGVAPIIYTSARVWRDDLKNLAAPDLVESPLWVTPYAFKAGAAVRDPSRVVAIKAPRCPPSWGEGNWWVHQYQGNATDFPGFAKGKIDMNRFNVVLKGETGPRVAWVQRRIGGAITSRYDATTIAAVRAFQARNNLASDGIIGPHTFAALCWTPPAGPQVPHGPRQGPVQGTPMQSPRGPGRSRAPGNALPGGIVHPNG